MRSSTRYWMAFPVGAYLIIGCLALSSIARAAEALKVTAIVEGPPEVVFDWKRDSCERSMVPDEPARAFKNDTGQVIVFATNDQNWSMSGSSLNNVRRNCGSAFHASGMSDPSKFDNDGWIEGIYSFNGRDVLALISNDWAVSDGEAQHNKVYTCNNYDVGECDYMSITIAKSTNSGKTFSYVLGHHVLAALPLDTFTTQRRTTGFATTSNVLSQGKYIYAFLGKRSTSPGQAGSCLFRSRTPFDPQSWEFWNGDSFSSVAIDETKSPVANGIAEICKPVVIPFPKPVELRSVSYLKDCDCYVAAFDGMRGSASGRSENGFFITASTNLVFWSKPSLVISRPFVAECTVTLFYPSLLDPAAADRNFADITPKPYLYYTRMNRTSCEGTANRDLVRVPIVVQVQK